MHPDELLEQLKANTTSRKAKNLDIIHAVCREQHERGSTDFSVATISKISQERGGPVTSTIHNKTGDDFKGLIRAWAGHTGG
ncbi:gamma-mobile-trio protein GmtX [Uliginosibacterium gangwonense]|uniref:gamma-mobile-trio protein GmtX n=1 Tax=Uliginosibacterium gangwonense TaxID=392736 RepID=UPI00037553AA|nr:gamma-mobile-trio protein GmtX [Uliginosibacterium gangwonense]